MVELAGEKNPKEIGATEVVAGGAAGIAAGFVAANMMGKQAVTAAPTIPTKAEVIQKIVQRIESKRNQAAIPIVQEFVQHNPPPRNYQKNSAYMEKLAHHIANSPAYKAFAEIEEKAALYEQTETTMEILKKAGKPSTVDDVFKAWEEAKPALKSPKLGVLSTGGKIGVGAVALASALGIGYLVNRWRNQEPATFAGRLDQERAEPKFRTLSDM